MRIIPAFVLTALLFSTAACSAPADIPPAADVHAPPEVSPPQAEFAAEPALALPFWRIQLSGAVNVSPVMSRDLVIVATADGVISAVRASTGESAWEFSPEARIWDASLSVDESYACAGLEGGQVVCLSATTGEPIWTVQLGIEVQSPMTLTRDRIYAPSTFVGGGLENDYQGKAKLFALDRKDGVVVWATQTDNYILRKPVAADDLIITGGLFLNEEEEGVNRLYALNAADGSPAWTYESDDGLVRWIERSEDVLMFVAYTETIQALDLESGLKLWNYGPGYWIQFPAIRDGIVYFGTGDHFMQALAISDGAVLWEQDFNMDALNQVGRPQLVADRLWFNSVTGEIYSFDTLLGQEVLHLVTGHTARVGGVLFENLYIMGDPDGFLYAYVIN